MVFSASRTGGTGIDLTSNTYSWTTTTYFGDCTKIQQSVILAAWEIGYGSLVGIQIEDHQIVAGPIRKRRGLRLDKREGNDRRPYEAKTPLKSHHVNFFHHAGRIDYGSVVLTVQSGLPVYLETDEPFVLTA